MDTYLLIVDFNVTNSDPDCLIKLLPSFIIDLLDRSRNDSLVRLVVPHAQHGVCFASTCLAVAHDSSIVPPNDTLYEFVSSHIIHVSLGRIVEDLRKLKLPVIKTIVYYTLIFLSDENLEVLCISNQVKLTK